MKLQYKQEISKYGKKDAITALCIFIVYCIIGSVFVITANAVDATTQHAQILGVLFMLVNIAAVMALVMIKKQGMKSLGIHTVKLWPALRLGLLFSLIPLIVAGILPGLLYGWELNSLGVITWSVPYFFILAFAEDIAFVGFIQTRVYGLIKTDRWAICAGAALFSLMHVPAWLIMGRLNLQNILLLAMPLVSWFIIHCIHVSLFKRYYSLFPVMIFHTTWNFSQSALWVFNEENQSTAEEWTMTATLILIVAVIIWGWLSRRRDKKKATAVLPR